ncbi:MAG TPA: apolipoprotein N-acyltransferase [Thermoanaerobaculia bacterium]|nr:apolipoprotein N-acyltransferase [Thermoanaerobaculia bacterium]
MTLSGRAAPWAAAAFAVAGGALWAWQFEATAYRLAPWLALAPLILLMGRRRAGWLGFLHGFVCWLVALSWIPPTLVTYGGLALPLAWALFSLLAAYLGLYHAAFAALGARVWRQSGRRSGLLPFLALPALWVTLEWLRTYALGGFPWNLAAYSWVDVPGALPLTAWIGPYGLSALVVLSSVGVAAALVRRRWQPLAVALAVPLLLLPLAGRWSSRDLAAHHPAHHPTPIGTPVRLVQPNTRNLIQWDPDAVLDNYRRVFALSEPVCEAGALVVWPESAAWPFAYGRDRAFADDLAALARRGCTVIFNSTHEAGESVFNSAYLLREGAPPVRYDKRHLVPFGEYVPFQGVFGFLDKLAREASSFRAAEQLQLLPWEEERIGMSICYEIVFPDEVAEATRAGATVLATITNDAWYGDTAAPWQHFRAAQFRAAENRRPLVRAAITGISALIAPDGSVRGRIGLFEEGVLRGRVSGRSDLTPYARLPWLVPALCCLVAAFAIIWTVLTQRRRGTK